MHKNKLTAHNIFSADARISFGMDGAEAVRELDFTAVRGSFEQNSFVKGVNENSIMIERKAKSQIEFLSGLR